MKRDLAAILSAIREEKGPSLLLLHGDDFQVHEATKALVDLVVPPEKKAFSLERFDGRAHPWDQIEAALKTPSFFAGKKVVLVENAPYFLVREHKGEVAERVLELWSEQKKDAAARLFLDLLVLEGWTQERWERLQAALSPSQVAELFGADDREVREAAQEVAAFCRTSGMELNERGGGEAHRLLELLEEGLPPWAVLLMTAPHVDRRTRLYRRLEEKGAALDLAVPREDSGRIKQNTLAEFLDRHLAESGKKIEPQARRMILERAGGQLWGMRQELEKLFLYVGEEQSIKARDVEEIFSDQAENWVFDLTKAIAERNSLQALARLARLLDQGNHPLALLGPVTNQVRRLLVARQFMDGEMRGRWRSGMSAQEFQRSVIRGGPLPLPGAPYANYKAFEGAANFTMAELLDHLQSLADTDIRLKSSAGAPRLVMERLVLEMCRPASARQIAK